MEYNSVYWVSSGLRPNAWAWRHVSATSCGNAKCNEHHSDNDCIFIVFLNFHPNRFCFNSEPHELVWKSVWPIMHRTLMSEFKIFSKFSKNGTRFPDFSDPRPKKIGFGAWGRFYMFFRSKNSSICLPYGQFCITSLRCSTTSFSCEPSRRYGISPF